jgi:hypothetical protein
VYFVFGCGVAVTYLVAAAWFAPVAPLFGIPLMVLCATIGAFTNAGIILSGDGIAWYALVPRWRFRVVPWQAVRGVRRNFFGRGGVVYITVESGRYEPTVRGEPRPGRTEILEVWLRTVVNSDELVPAVEEWLRWRDAVAEAPGVTSADAGTW